MNCKAWFVLLALGIVGCGKVGPERFEVSGAVTFNGVAVPAGSILFEPDAKRGNSGPVGQALIQNGQYRTLPEKGVVGGPHVAILYTFDGKSVADEGMPQGRALRSAYQSTIELPREKSIHDFTIPR